MTLNHNGSIMEQLSAHPTSQENNSLPIEEVESSNQNNDIQENNGLPIKEAESSNQNDDIEVLQNLISDRYHVIKKLGKGSQGAVFLAESNYKHEKVAIKQLIIQSVKDWKQYDLFKREAATLKRMNIPHVAKLHETIEMLDIETPMALIVQDFIEGEPLQKFIANGHRFQISQIGDILLQLLDILEKLHHSFPPVIHRDIKPSNIILNYVENDTTPQVFLIDFGAVANPQVKGGGSTVVGTYGYMAPEQLMGNATASSDLYSLAIVAVYLLSGVPPEELEIQDFRVLIDPHLQHLPHQITSFLRKMLEPHKEERINNYKQLHEFFDALKTQQFNKIPNVGSSLTSKENYSLDKVYSFHQPGNIVLWQNLPDNTPRKLNKNINKVIYKEFNNYTNDNYYQQKFMLILIFSTLTILCLSFLLVGLLNPSLGYDTFKMIIIYISLTVILIIIFGIQRADHRDKFLRCFKYNPKDFFKNARKSMATVTHIGYKPIFFNMNNGELRMNEYYPATWLITYAFNPPDDSSPDVLIRSFETHSEPDFKEGDLIPILYLIVNDDNGEHIYSSPYPIPVTDSFTPTEK